MTSEPLAPPADSRLAIEGEEDGGAPKVDGRSREARAARAAGRTHGTRQTGMRDLPQGQYYGRNGEILTRSTQVGDQFEVPATLKEPGWDYQWLTEHILGNPDVVRRHNHIMYQTGWRAVHATGRWNGVFGPKEDTGHIRMGDCGLYERPLQMSEDAREEEQRKALTQMRDRDEALMGGKANIRTAMRDGFEMGKKYRGTGGDLRMSIDPGLDAPKPRHELAEPGE